MSFWAIAGGLTALAAGITLAPLGRPRRGLALILMILIPAMALGLYMWLGATE